MGKGRAASRANESSPRKYLERLRVWLKTKATGPGVCAYDISWRLRRRPPRTCRRYDIS
jgi:hypothetical protein